MKALRYIMAAAVLSLTGTALHAQDDRCDLDISIANITKGDIVPEAVNSRLEAKLTQAMSKAGLIAAPYDSRFFVAGRFDDALNDITGGPSPKVIIKTTLTIYIGDAEDQKVFASESFELKGVGGNDQQAYTNALNKISGSNRQLIDFLAKGKDKIIEYFNNNYAKYLNDARQQMSARNYDAALYYATLVPSCCNGYAEASALALQIYNQSMNYNAQQLLAQARAAWAADPTASGAEIAHGYLAQIDPAATCAGEAKAFGEDIAKTVKKQWEFENVTKYKDELALRNKALDNRASIEKARIAAAKAVAVAWAQSRPRTVNRYVFLR